MRKIPVPSNRYTPLKENWMKIFTPIVEHLHLQIRFNLKTRNVEIKVSFHIPGTRIHTGCMMQRNPSHNNSTCQLLTNILHSNVIDLVIYCILTFIHRHAKTLLI